MKVVINTQYRENYGTAKDPYWKFKGGHTYVIPNLTKEQADKAVATGCPTITELINYSDSYSEEYVLEVHAAEDDAVVCDPWETVIILNYVAGSWYATEVTENGEYGYMRSGISRKIVTYVLGKFEETVKVNIVLNDGREMSYADAMNELV
jgi:hypothetical protein